MACSKPLTQFRYQDGTCGFADNGNVVSSFPIGCGQCALCRAARGAEIATRLVQEAYSWDHNICVTLTYADDKLPALGSLSHEHYVKFLKRLRFAVAKRGAPKLRFDLVAEYSPQALRPHYHACLFNYAPADYYAWDRSRGGNPQYRSEELERFWPHGNVWFQWFSDGAASYVAGHQCWKLNGERAFERLRVRDADGAVIGDRAPEFHRCSTMPGLGAEFFRKYGAQMMALGFTVVGTKKVPIPSYYLRLAERVPEFRERCEQLQYERWLHTQDESAIANSTDARLAVREECRAAAVQRLGRGGDFA